VLSGEIDVAIGDDDARQEFEIPSEGSLERMRNLSNFAEKSGAQDCKKPSKL
jgi:hypothetical protein